MNFKQSAYYCRRLHQSPQTRNLEQLINTWWDWNLKLKSFKHFLLRTSHIYDALQHFCHNYFKLDPEFHALECWDQWEFNFCCVFRLNLFCFSNLLSISCWELHIYMMLSNTFARTTSSWIQSSMLSNIEISENLTFVVCFFWTCSVSLDADNCLVHEESIQRGQKPILSQTTLKGNVVNCNHVTHLLMMMMMMVMSITQCSYYNTKVLDEVLDGEYLTLNIVVSCCCNFCYLM